MENRRLEMFQMGVAVNAAMSDDPRKNLEKILNPIEMDLTKVHPMLRGSIGK